MIASNLRFDAAFLPTGWADDVRVSVDAEGFIVDVTVGADAAASLPQGGAAEHWHRPGVAVPGVANVHSHAHQRAMVGLAERSGPAGSGPDSFWTWRETMYGLLESLSPDDLEAIAAQLYVEMLRAGFTAVGEFQYLHHQPDGSPYADRAEMTLRCLGAARRVGIGFTALPVLYGHGGFGGQPPTRGQRRFVNRAEAFLDLAERLREAVAELPEGAGSVGIAPHSLRAVSPDLLHEVLASTPAHEPVHLHIAEQQREVDDCLAWCGQRPVEWLLDHCPVDERWCLVHATHMTPREARDLARTGAVVALCPTTEANLGDGIFPATDYRSQADCRSQAGDGPSSEPGRIAIGSDSHVEVDPAADLRLLEYGQRLRDRARTVLAGGPDRSTGRALFERVLAGGARALGRPIGAIAPGHRADFAILDLDHPALLAPAATGRRDAVLDGWIFAGGGACVRHVLVGGRPVIEDGHHADEDAISDRFRATLKRLHRRG